MYKHILIPTDGSELSGLAITQGVALARALGARVTGVTVTEPFQFVAVEPPVMMWGAPEQYDKDIAAMVARHLAAVMEAAAAANVPSDVVHVVDGHPYRGIIDTANARSCDLIFMASHGRKGVSALLMGSETTKVLTHSKTPVLVCR